MFFEDEKENLENFDDLDDINLDLSGEEDDDDESISWDELLKDTPSSSEVVSITDLPLNEIITQDVTSLPETSTPAKPDAAALYSGTKELQEDDEESFDFDFQDDSQVQMNNSDFSNAMSELDEKYEQAESNEMSSEEDYEYYAPDSQEQSGTNKKAILLGSVLAIVVFIGAAFYMMKSGNMLAMFNKAPKTNPNPPVFDPTVSPVPTAPEVPSLEGMPNVPTKVGVVDPASPELPINGMPNPQMPPSAKMPPQMPSNVQVDPNAGVVKLPDVTDKKVADQKAPVKKDENKKVSIDVKTSSRLNPFLPMSNDFNAVLMASGLDAYVENPPLQYGDDPSLQELVNISVSGILFDSSSPSAIIRINQTDYFVQKGDKVDEFYISDINRDAVVIKKDANVFSAGVGQMFNYSDTVNGRAVINNNGTKQYKTTTAHTSAEDVQIRTRM